MSKSLHVSSNPHIRDRVTTRGIMLNVILALLPATAFGVYQFGLRALLVILVTVAASVLSEAVYLKLMHKEMSGDGSAIVTGLLLALNLPVGIPYWMAAIGAFFAIIVVKQLFGGLGQNFMNPALGARCFMLISFTQPMTAFVCDGVAGATPLAVIKNGGEFPLTKMFLGNCGGTIGETCALALIIGGVYLIITKLIDWRIPVVYIASFAVFMLLFAGRGFDTYYLAQEICGGGLLLGAFFMATDYVTSPITHKGRIIFGIFLGIMTGCIRLFSESAEGVSYAIIIGNILVPLIDKISMPTGFGIPKKPLFGRKEGNTDGSK